MQKFKLSSAVLVAAIAAFAGTTVAASAQDATTVYVPAKKKTSGYASRVSEQQRVRPVTITKPADQSPVAGPLGIVTAPIGFATQIATAPLSGLSQAFGYGAIGGPAKPLPIVARYVGAGPVTDSVNQGWAQPVPLASNGPIYKLEPVSNTGGVSPFALIAAPITAATTLATAPVYAVGGVLGGPAAPAPVF